MYLMQAVNVSGVPDQVYQQNLELAKQFDSRDMSPPALFARASVQSHHEWMQHDHLRTAVRYAWHRFFADWDVLLCPIANTAAFPHNHGLMEQRLVDVNGEMRPYFEANFWASLASLAGLPATVAPMGLNKEKLPLGVQIVGAEFADETTIAVSGLLKELGFSFTPPPALAGSS